jgi:beta-N-acetylhexosaminidase
LSANSPDCRPVIFGIAGKQVSDAEGAFFHDTRPWGIILFARNIDDGAQLKALTDSLRDMSGRPHLPILIDQEGGRVARVKPPLAIAHPPAACYGAIYERDRQRGLDAARLGARLLADDLLRFGINISCAPCMDLGLPDMSDVIGDRAFGGDANMVGKLGAAFAKGLDDGGVLPVIKHLPGHGRARVDSHHDLPIIGEAVETLKQTDFAAFGEVSGALLGMTGHLLFEAIDAAHVSTFSTIIVEQVIREIIGFDGLLMSDDLSMQALAGDMASRTQQALAAGCDMVLHCNGDMAEMEAVASALPAPQVQADVPRLAAVHAALAALPVNALPENERRALVQDWGELVSDVFPDALNAV